MKLLDRVLPAYDVRERHSLAVDASPECVFAALRAVPVADMPVVRLLVRVRGIGARAHEPLLEQMQRAFAVLAEEPDRELVLGSIGRPWKPRGGDSPRAEFATFDRPGYAKMAIDFVFDGGVLSTETRVQFTDASARRRFRPYWLVIRPFSGLIRRRWLRAVKRRAEGR